MKKIILIFGYGYVSKFLSKYLINTGWKVYCTSRSLPDHDEEYNNISIINFFDCELICKIIESASVILSTAPPAVECPDPVLQKYAEKLSQGIFSWVGYLSSTGVYGDHNGNWVDEDTLCRPTNAHSETRLWAEKQWLLLYKEHQIPVHIFRLSGIYGPTRNCLEELRRGKNFTVFKNDHFFSRIHVDDICLALMSSINEMTPGEIYNISDDEPAPVHMVQQFGANALNIKKLREIPLEEAALSEFAKTFFRDNRKISNRKVTQKLGIKWKYPNYREGLLHELNMLHNLKSYRIYGSLN